MNTISFMTANYVARPLGWRMTKGWGQGDEATQAYFRPMETFAERFDEYMGDVAALGVDHCDLWTSILSPAWATEDHVVAAKDILEKHNLKVVSLAGWFSSLEGLQGLCRLANALNTSLIGGGSSADVLNDQRGQIVETLRRHGIKWGYENHPEKTPDEILNKIGAGDEDVIGVCADTGWFGTQGYDGPTALEALAPRLFHVHLKDVLAAGAHDTCRFGMGVVNIEGCVRTLKRVGYTGPISVEHEPEDFDPTDDVSASIALLREWLTT